MKRWQVEETSTGSMLAELLADLLAELLSVSDIASYSLFQKHFKIAG